MSVSDEPRRPNVQQVRVIPTGGPLGAYVEGIDLSDPLARSTVCQLHQALLEHCVLVARDQQITDADQLRLTNYFCCSGQYAPEHADRSVGKISLVSNVRENGQSIGALGSHEIDFHSDLSYLRKPATISILHAIEVPLHGGQTQWANCYLAYEDLHPSLKRRLEGLRAIHLHYIDSENPPEPVDHPVVRTHPETGRKSLYVGPHLTKSIAGQTDADSRLLLSTLFEHLDQQRYVWTHQWAVGDVVIWDNRPTLHRRLPFPDNERRVMKRTHVYGDEVPV